MWHTRTLNVPNWEVHCELGWYEFATGTARVDGSLGTAIHEYVHHLQATLPGFQLVFRAQHLRRTTHNGKRDPVVSVDGHQDVRPDDYIDVYAGRDYAPAAAQGGAVKLPDAEGIEVPTVGYAVLLDSLASADYLPKMAADDPGCATFGGRRTFMPPREALRRTARSRRSVR